MLLLLKTHVEAYTKKDGTFVAAHEDKRAAAMTLFHGSRERVASIKDAGLFGGIFASPLRSAAASHGDVIHRVNLDESEVMTQRMMADVTDDDLMAVAKWVDSDDLERLRELVIDDVQATDDDARIMRTDDAGEASWEAQRLRGAIAKRRGFKAVEMNDEHGTSYLVLPGVDLAHDDDVDERPHVAVHDRRPMYVSRKVLNGKDLHDWAVAQGFTNVTPPEKMHVTVAYSRAPVHHESVGPDAGTVMADPVGLGILGDDDASVLRIEHPHLQARFQHMLGLGASWDHEGGKHYKPHVTVSYKRQTVDHAKVQPYTGEIHLGPEKVEDLKSGWGTAVAKGTMAKALDFGELVLFTKARVGPYLRGGKLVNVGGYDGRMARGKPSPGQLSLFAPPPQSDRPNPYKGKDPVLDTPDLFTGETRREAPVAPPPAAPAPPPAPMPANPHPLDKAAARLAEVRAELAEAQASGDKSGAHFYTLVLEGVEREHRQLASAFEAFNKHGDGTELSDKDGKRHAILLPDASSPGKYRYQMFDDRGFSAHSTHESPEAAVADAASSGFHVHNPGVLDKLAGTDEWGHGMAMSAIMQAHNGGQIDWKTATDRMAALHEEREARRNPRPAAAPAPAAAPVTVAGKRRVRADIVNGESAHTMVKLSDGSEHRIDRLGSAESMGLPGWHHDKHGFLGDTEDTAAQQLAWKHKPAAGPAEPAAAPAAAAPVHDVGDDHPSKPTKSLLSLVPADKRAEWLDLHKRQHEMHHYDLGQLKEQIAKHRTPMHRALTNLREAEALAVEARKGGDLPGTDERIRLTDNAVAQRSIEFQRHSKEVERLKNVHQQVYEKVAALGRQKNAIASETGGMDIDFAAMRQRTPEDQGKHEAWMLKRYRAHYKAQDAERRAAKNGGTLAKAWDWLGTEPVQGQRVLFLAR